MGDRESIVEWLIAEGDRMLQEAEDMIAEGHTDESMRPPAQAARLTLRYAADQIAEKADLRGKNGS